MPGKESQVPEEQRLGRYRPMGVQEQPVKEEEVSGAQGSVLWAL